MKSGVNSAQQLVRRCSNGTSLCIAQSVRASVFQIKKIARSPIAMLATPGLRVFSLAAKRGSEGVSCDAQGIFVGGVPLLQAPSEGNRYWRVRPVAELNKELTARYRLPIDLASKVGGLALIAAALNRGDLAMAAIAAVQMQFPEPPPLEQGSEKPQETVRRAQELVRSGLLKF
jgi:hypothetical protein